jgi:hypothetical protein
MRDRRIGRAPDYTNAALIMIGVNLFCAFVTLWAFWGLVPVVLLGAGLNRAIGWLARHRG